MNQMNEWDQDDQNNKKRISGVIWCDSGQYRRLKSTRREELQGLEQFND